MTTPLVNFGTEKDLDLNSVFTLNYNFDLLKTILENLLKAQKANAQKIEDFEDKLRDKDKKIENLEKQIESMNLTIQNLVINMDNGDKNRLHENRLEEKRSDESRTVIIDDSKFTNELNNRIAQLEIDNDGKLKLIHDRLISLESQIKIMTFLETDLTEVKKKLTEQDESIKSHKYSIEDIYKRLDILTSKVSEFSLTEILNKKMSNIDSEGGDEERYSLIISLVKNLESKVDRLLNDSKLDDEINTLKKEISTLKSLQNDTDKVVKHHTEQITNILHRLEEITFNTNTSINKLKDNLQDMLRRLKIELEERIDELHLLIKNTEIKSETNVVPQDVTEGDSKIIRDLQRRIIEIEKIIKVISKPVNLDDIFKEISEIKDSLYYKAEQQDLLSLKSTVDSVKIEVEFHKESINQAQEDISKIFEDIQVLKKRIEHLTSSMLVIKNSDDTNNASSSFKINIDAGRYVEISTFNEFKIQMGKEIDRINNILSEIKRAIDDIINELRLKANSKDLMSLEEYFIIKIEELKNGCNKKFADKNEMAKGFKILEGQIKHIIDVYIKKMEKGENWLLAKKPLEGFSCASCEAYIGDLKDNTQYVPWNKYPMRDPNDKLYRLGNGFSKMLQMLNVDTNENNGNLKKQNYQTSANFYKPEKHEKKEVNLPQVKTNRKNAVNMSADDIEINNEDVVEDPLQPKIMKIYKKVSNK